MDVRSLQRPLKEQYRREPSASRIILTARGAETATPMTCSVDIGRAIYQAEAHKGVGGTGTAACSGDLLLGALAACAQITCQLVAVAMAIQPSTSRLLLPAIWICRVLWGFQRMFRSALKQFASNLILTRRRHLQSRCERCMRKRNNIASCCKPCC